MSRIIQAGEAIQPTTLTTFIPIRIKRSGGRKVVVPASNETLPRRTTHLSSRPCRGHSTGSG